MHIYCKTCNKYTANTFPKKLVSFSKNKIKGESRRAICFNKKSFIDDIEYDLEISLEYIFNFLLNNIIKHEKRYPIRS